MGSPAQSFGDFAKEYAKEPPPGKPDESFGAFVEQYNKPGPVARGIDAAYQNLANLPAGLLHSLRPAIWDGVDALNNTTPEQWEKYHTSAHKLLSQQSPDVAAQEQTDQDSLPEFIGGMAGTGIGGLITAAMLHGAYKGYTRGFVADPAKDLINVYHPSDPRFRERTPQALAAIKKAAGDVTITGNDHLDSTSPTQVLTKAFDENRAAWDRWYDPHREYGSTAHGGPIVAATEASLKESLSAKNRAKILKDAARYNRPLTVPELEDMLHEKNGELNPFYSKDEAAREAARQAGASTGRSQALLEAQAKKIRDLLYNIADPENDGAGPRNIQRRYGGIKALQDEATAAGNSIAGETAGTPLGKITKTLLSTVDAVTSPLREGGLTEGLLNIPQQSRGKSNPLIARAFKNAPAFEPYPEPSVARPGTKLLGAPAPNYNVNGVTVPDMAGEIQQGTNALYNGPRQLNAPANEVGAPGGIVPIFKNGKIVGYVDHGPRQGGGVVAPDMAGQIRQGTTQMNVGPRQLAAPANEVGAPGGTLPIFKNGQIVGYQIEGDGGGGQFASTPNGPRQGGGVTVPDIVNRSSRGQGTPRPLITAPDPNNPGVNVLPRGVTINTSDVQGPGPFPPQPPREYATGPGGTVPIRSKETPIPLGKPGNTLGIDEHGRPVRPPTTPKAERRAAVTPAPSEAEETGPSAPVKGYATNDIRKNVESQRYFSKRYSQLTEAQQELVDRRVQGLPLRLKDLGHLQ